MLHGQSVWTAHHKELAYTANEYPDCSMYSFFAENTAKYRDYIAIEYYGGKMTYSRLVEKIEIFSAALKSLGVDEGKAVSIILPNIPQAVIAVYAVNRLGGICNILHPLLPMEDLRHAVMNAESTAVITLDKIAARLSTLCNEQGFSPVFITAGIDTMMGLPTKAGYKLKNKGSGTAACKSALLWTDLMRKGRSMPVPEVCSKGFDDTSVILYSGGTLGKPKGIELTNGNFNALTVQLLEAHSSDSIAGLNSLALMPVFHGFGLGVSIHGMLCIGGHVFLIPEYNMIKCSKLIFKKKIGLWFGVPALLEAISRSEEIEKQNLSFITSIVCSGDAFTSRLRNRLNGQLAAGGSSARAREAYGLTECTSGCCIDPYFGPKDGSIGIPFTDMKMAIVDPSTNEPLPAGEIGEICISGPTVMKGYYKNPAATAEVLKLHSDGLKWLHTGDLGRQDEDGYFYFVQRKANMIISAGYNVYPAVLEKAVLEHESVSQCCVVGKADAVLGQRILLFVIPKASPADNDALRKNISELCREKLPVFSQPHRIIIIDKFPRTAFGKIDKTELLKLEQEI